MTAATLYRPVLPDHARVSDDPAILAAILAPGINLAVWRRGPLPVVPDSDVLAEVDDVSIICGSGEVGAEMRRTLAMAGYAPAAVEALAGDAAMLGRRFARLVDRERIAIRLEVIETDACRRFHADYVSARLICTYVGAATQWLVDADAVALRAGAGLATLAVQHLQTGDVALFKGREWAPGGAIVHRSPPIAGTGQRRLVLVIDPAPEAPIAHA